MTAVLEHAAPAGIDPVSGPAAVHAVLDHLPARTVMTAGQAATEVAEWDRVLRRVEALKLAALAAAQHYDVARASGWSGTEAWLAQITRTGRRGAARQVRLATALDEQLSATARAFGKGLVSAGHAAVIADAAGDLPGHLSPAERTTVEEALVDKAGRMDPIELKRAARRCLEALPVPPPVVDEHENTVLDGEERAARARIELQVWENADGTTSGRFTVDRVAGAVLRTIIDAMTSPRRVGIAAARTGRSVSHDADERAHLAGQAFATLLERLPTDHLPHKSAATVLVTVPLSVLESRLAAAGLSTGESISAGRVRRIACSASILSAVLGGKSQILDLGSTRRLFTEAQRTALALRHDTCAADGCARPYAWCELHPRRPSRGGPTDLDNAVPLCNFHHQRIHDPRYNHDHRPGGAVAFHRRT